MDGECCFYVKIIRDSKDKTGWRVQLSFSIGLHQKDKVLLKEIKSFFGVGSLNTKHGAHSIQYRVFSIEDLEVIITHFEKYKLLTQKRADFEL